MKCFTTRLFASYILILALIILQLFQGNNIHLFVIILGSNDNLHFSEQFLCMNAVTALLYWFMKQRGLPIEKYTCCCYSKLSTRVRNDYNCVHLVAASYFMIVIYIIEPPLYNYYKTTFA